MVYLEMYRLTRKLSLLFFLSSSSSPNCFFILSAVCHVRQITSPTRPIACESEDIMLKMPRSCRISSAPIVSGRIRESAKDTSSGIFLLRWWHTINISMCSSNVLTVYGRVGFVDDGNIFGYIATLIMSGA